MRVATLTVSTSRAGSVADDPGTLALARYVASMGAELVGAEVIPDDRPTIERRLRDWADGGRVDVILTSGGTGLAASDVTPEATRAVIDREAPGIAEAMRLASKPHTKYWMMSRGVAGTRGRVVIINFPGNPKAIAQAGEPLRDVLAHATALLRDPTLSHG